MNPWRLAGWALLAATILFGLAPLYRGGVEFPIRVHHLLHTAVLIGAALAGIALAGKRANLGRGRTLWLILAVLSPAIAMLLMWPSEYSPLEKLPAAHVGEHLALVAFGFLTGYAGQRYAYGVGWAMGLSLWGMALLSAWGFGVSPPLQVPGAEAAAPVAQSGKAAPPNVAHGRALFAQNCASCHGNAGQGGMGPALKNEAARKNFAQASDWIEHPKPPMPALYPGSLSEQDVRDVAAFVESLR